jgi:hypothetical protein
MKPFLFIALVLITLVGGLFAWNWYEWHRMKTGYEVSPHEYSSYLKSKLSEDFGYDGFEQKWLKKAWVNGFQDHTYLFVVEADSGSLKETIETKTGTEAIQASFFQNGSYLGPSTAPDWWNSTKTNAADSRYFEKNSTFWRFTWFDNRLYIVYCN